VEKHGRGLNTRTLRLLVLKLLLEKELREAAGVSMGSSHIGVYRQYSTSIRSTLPLSLVASSLPIAPTRDINAPVTVMLTYTGRANHALLDSTLSGNPPVNVNDNLNSILKQKSEIPIIAMRTRCPLPHTAQALIYPNCIPQQITIHPVI